MISISKTGCGQSLHNCGTCFHYTGYHVPACRQLTCTYKFNLKRFWKALNFDFSFLSRLKEYFTYCSHKRYENYSYGGDGVCQGRETGKKCRDCGERFDVKIFNSKGERQN